MDVDELQSPCGHPARPGARFCPSCGSPTGQQPALPVDQTPAPSRLAQLMRGRVRPAILVALGIAVAAGAVFGVVQLREPGVAVGSVVTTAPTPASNFEPPTDDGSEADPAVVLAALVEQDRVAADQLLGQWVPQVSAKKVGTADDGTIYDEAAILAAVRTAKARYPQALLIRSDDYSSFRLGGFWVIVVATPSVGADGANAWCERNDLSRDDCFAKRLSHTDGPQGSTVPRR